jgi:hypothetical protein
VSKWSNKGKGKMAMNIDSKISTAILVLCILWGSIALSSQYTNLVHNGVHAGEQSQGAQNVALGTWAFYQGGGTNTISIGTEAGYKAEMSDGNVFIGDGAGRESSDIKNCIAIGPGEMAGETNVTDAISIGGRIVMRDNVMYITPEAMRHTVYAPIFWFNGNHVLTADRQLVLSCPSNVIIKAGHGLYLQGVKHCDWTPRMVLEDGALQVYTNGVRAGSIPLSGN